MKRTHATAKVVSALASWWPLPVEPSADLVRALAFLGASIDARSLLRASNVVATAVALVGILPVLLAPPSIRLVAVATTLALSFAIAHVARRGPLLLATARRTSALGTAPAVLGRAVLRMRIEPASERAAAFAARTGSGPLAASLRDHVRRADGTPRSGLADFGATWADWNPPLRRATLLVEAAADAPAGERGRTLDRATTAIVEGTRDRMATFAEDIHGPTTALYAFGVLLPLALVAVLPAARVAGLALSTPVLVALYDVLLPLVLVGASAWLLVRRPAAFPPPAVSSSHPDVPDQRWPVLLGGVVVGACAFTLVSVAPLPAWSRWLAAIGAGCGTVLLGWFRPVKQVRDHARAVESNLTDALYHVGRRVEEGRAVEGALADAAAEVAGETGETLDAAVGVQRRLRLSVRDSFLGEYGALADVPSPQARSVAHLLAVTAREGRPAGRAVVTMADHIDDLQRVERDARRELTRVTGTLRNTAAVFAPLVGGATVALAEGMAAPEGSTGTQSLATPLPADALGLAVGAYVLLLAVILTALATGLERGLDRALVGYRVGLALPTATTTYLAAFVGAGLLT
ncbi:type II secretion system protein [Halorussus halophilus]|uniref:type II secretion system protein n=1 Tax=Halorussus halophilus TaxID=2650975 RepID=UPI001CE46E4A|nr:type II secretion system protein [Halorussus halophilus]